VIVGAGDIAGGDAGGNAELTARLLDGIAGTVFTTGDNAYVDGTLAEFLAHYDTTWGRQKARTRPAPGNHDYQTPGGSGYYGYFGAAAGDPSKGYYSYDIGAWHAVVLNSNCSEIGGCNAGSRQESWLRRDLAASTAKCTIAFWHHPLFNTGYHGNETSMQPLWQALYDNNADVVVEGHDHNYQRFAPLTASGEVDAVRGIRSFVVGTGGAGLYAFTRDDTRIERRDATTFGVLKVTLHATTYDWAFVPVGGMTFTDSGSGTCH
jgi:hypothetical protein